MPLAEKTRGCISQDERPMDILFSVLPFASVLRPAIGVSLLQAAIARLGLSAPVAYFNLDFAGQLGAPFYRKIAYSFDKNTLVGEWIFAEAAFPGQVPGEGEYQEKILAPHSAAELRALIPDVARARRLAGEAVARWAAAIEREQPRVVGFTTTYHQTCACLAVARRLKQAA